MTVVSINEKGQSRDHKHVFIQGGKNRKKYYHLTNLSLTCVYVMYPQYMTFPRNITNEINFLAELNLLQVLI